MEDFVSMSFVFIYVFIYLTSVETSNNFQNIWSLRRKGKAKGSCCFQVKKNKNCSDKWITDLKQLA